MMEDTFLRIVEKLLSQNPDRLSPLGAGVLAAAHFGLSGDSRGLASKLGVAHALVLRECVALADEQRLIDLQDREDRSQRVFFMLNRQGQDILTRVG